jgi:flagellar basal body-associated protein FliL
MADKKEKKETQTPADEKKKSEGDEKKKPKKEKKQGEPITKSTWIIAASIVVAGILGGFALAQLLGPSGPPKLAEAGEVTDTKDTKKTWDQLVTENAENKKAWYYDQLEPIIGNLDEPGITRHVRATIVLEISSEMDQEKGYLFLQDKKVVISDFLSTYFAGLSLERVRGSRNRTRIKNEIKEHLNDLLFPDSKPFISNVLTQDFSVQ